MTVMSITALICFNQSLLAGVLDFRGVNAVR